MIIRGLLPGAHAAVVIAGTNLLAACSVGPDYAPPTPRQPANKSK
jgi:hypothetical protein